MIDHFKYYYLLVNGQGPEKLCGLILHSTKVYTGFNYKHI